MKQVIENKVYNTETSTLLHEWDNGHFTTDFRFRAKTLYRTAKGSLFIHHEGGAMSDMARSHGNSVGGGEEIEPVSVEDAIAFLASHGGEDVITEYFADQVDEA
jgi:hypothetical protein